MFNISNNQLYLDVTDFINESYLEINNKVHKELVKLYWFIGNRIRVDVLLEKRAKYGEEIIKNLSKRLVLDYGKNFNKVNLLHMIRFAEIFPDKEDVKSLSSALTWSHFRILIYIHDDVKRDFYAKMCHIERWSVRILRKKIDSMFFERTAISKKPKKLIQQELKELGKSGLLNKNFIFRDPYIFDFLRLHDTYSEKDLENSILYKLEYFLLELGCDFSFIARQKRITIDNEDYYIDLLFYHRGLCALVAIELKLSKFKAEHKGQMELYLRYLEKHEKKENENRPIGIILCAEKAKEVVELLSLADDNIHVAEYWTKLPSKEVLQQKLHCAIDEAQQEMEQREIPNSRTNKKQSAIGNDILAACKDWKSVNEITEITNYNKEALRKQIKILITQSLLEYKYPDKLKHPRQKYRAVK